MRLKELRIKNGLKQETVANAIGCSLSAYSRYESGLRQPNIDILKTLSALFGVSIDYIVKNDTFVKKNNPSDSIL